MDDLIQRQAAKLKGLYGKKADMLIYHNRIVAWMPMPEPYKEGETT